MPARKDSGYEKMHEGLKVISAILYLAMIEVVVLFSIFVIKQAPQEILVQILDAINSFINNPLFTDFVE
jgi:hypothetical protein